MAVSRGKHREKIRNCVVMHAGSTPQIGCVFIMGYDSKAGIYEVVEDTSETLDPKCHRCGLNHKCSSGRIHTVPECTKSRRTDGK